MVEPEPVIVPALPVSKVVSTESAAKAAEEKASKRRPILDRFTNKDFMWFSSVCCIDNGQ